MNRKQSFSNIIWTILAILFLAVMFYIKGTYYHYQYIQGWFNSGKGGLSVISVLWGVFSMILSAMPMICLFVGNLTPEMHRSTLWKLLPLAVCIVNLFFEVISMFGSGMTLDREWSEIADKMFKYQAASLALIILCWIISSFENKKRP